MKKEGKLPHSHIKGRNHPNSTTYITIPALGYGALTFLRPERDCWLDRWRINADGSLDIDAIDLDGSPVELRRVG